MLNTKATDITDLNIKPDITNLVTKAVLNTKFAEGESKTPEITNLAITATLDTKATEIENKIPDITNFITSPEFNRLAKVSFDAEIKKTSQKSCKKKSNKYCP